MDDGRRCALTGCDARILPTAGRPERRYCTAAHRAAARRVRRAADRTGHPDDPAVLAEALPWLREPAEPVTEPVAVVVVPAPRRRVVRLALVLLGAAGVLAAGYALAVAAEPAGPEVVRSAEESPAVVVDPRARAVPEALRPRPEPPRDERPSEADLATLAELRERVVEVARAAREAEAGGR